MSVSNTIKRFILCVISYAFMVSPALSKAPDDFYQAKLVVYRLFKDHKTTLYCQCPFNERRETDLKGGRAEEPTKSGISIEELKNSCF